MDVPTTLTCLALAGATAFAAPGDPTSKTSPDARAPRGPVALTPAGRPAFEALGGPPPNDLCVNAAPVGVPSTTPGSTLLATVDTVPDCSGTLVNAPGVWYRVTGTGSTITASLCSAVTDYDTSLSIYCGDCAELESDCCVNNGTPGCSDPDCEAAVCAVDAFCCDTSWDDICADEAADLCGSTCALPLLCVASNDDFCGPDGLQSQVSWCAQIGAQYLVLVHGYDGDAGNFELTLTADGLPCLPTVQCLPPACRGDTNGDKDVDVNDLNNVIVGWGGDGQLGFDPITGQLINADITDAMGGPPDGIVNVNDLNAVIVNWGPCDPPPNDECEGKPDVPVVPNGSVSVPVDMRGATPSMFGVSGCGDCNVPDPDGAPGCSDPTCQGTVCAVDPFCCDTNWDGICAGEAADLCDCALTPLCTEPAKDVWYCLSVPDFGGTIEFATTLDLFAEVYAGCDCTQPPVYVFCGLVQDGSGPILVDPGDQLCVRLLNSANLPNGILVGNLVVSSQVICGAGAGECCLIHGTPGCNDLDCCSAICAVDAFCCDVVWDNTCAWEASSVCGLGCCGFPGTGDCCSDNGSPYCEDAACCQTVCGFDPYCCESEWDNACAGEAIVHCAVAVCGPCGNIVSGDCCTANGTPGCNNLDCCNTICGLDPFCCENQWDQVCADEAAASCPAICGP